MKRLFLLFTLMFIVAFVFGQDSTDTVVNPFPGGETSVTELVSMYDVLYTALVVIWGYIGRLFKFTANTKSYVFIVLAGAIVLAIAFIWLGFSEVFPLVFSFLGAIGIYDIFLKPLGADGQKVATLVKS